MGQKLKVVLNVIFFLVSLSGVKSVLVGLLAQKAEVKHDKHVIIAEEIVLHVKSMGFECDQMDKSGQGEAVAEILVSPFFVTLLECLNHFACSNLCDAMCEKGEAFSSVTTICL